MENSTFITDSEITEYLNQELAELWARLGQGQAQPFYRASTPIAVTAGVATYPLPADFFQVQGVDATINGITGALVAFMPIERGALSNSNLVSTLSPVRYRIQGNNIEFQPATITFTATLFYTPSQPRLVNPSDTFDGFNGFEVAAIYGTVATMLAKEESDPSFYLGQKERIYRHIDSLAAQRDASQPDRVADVLMPRGFFGPWGLGDV